jgi:hypothetical protein
MQTTSEIHIKAVLDNEFRRFALNPPTCNNLTTTLRSLFHIDKYFKIMFKDDENDWVLLTSDQELLHANELAGSPLRLQIQVDHSRVPPAPHVFPNRCRGGKAMGKAARCGGRGCWKVGGSPNLANKGERLALKSTRLASRISMLEAKLKEGSLNADREQTIRWKLVLLRNKLDVVKSIQQVPQEVNEIKSPAPTETVPTTPMDCEEAPAHKGRGGCYKETSMTFEDQNPARKGRRGCCFGDPERCQRKWERAGIPPEIFANFRQCKLNLQAARKTGNSEQIESCFVAFKLAKQQKQEAKAKLRSEKAVKENEVTATPTGTSSM